MKIATARRQGGPILAVGTTVVRALEDAAQKATLRRAAAGRAAGEHEPLEPGTFEAEVFIFPGYEFRVVNQLLTNFHLPKSSLLVMVCAFAGRETISHAYQHAIEQQYRFYSYGDCMLIR